MIGETIGRYKITEKLGSGGMGEVYLADDVVLDRRVAIKILRPDATSDPQALLRFQREARAAAALDHPNIVTIHEVGERDGLTYIAMAYVPGQTLTELIGRGSLSIDRALEIALQILAGLSRAHEAGIVHRDIKPGNVVLDEDGHVRILDFGLAKVDDHTMLTRQDTTVGTLYYMSPEQARGEEVDGRTDLFSVGAVLYEMITGRRPFTGEHAAAIHHAIANTAPAPMARYANDVNPELERIVRKLLAKDPGTRYQSAADVMADIRSLRSGSHESVTIPAAAPRGGRRWPAVAAVVAVAVLAAATTLFLVRRGEAPVAGLEPPMVAVLPFENLGLAEDEFFVDGITDEVIARLSGISGLGVISRRSAMHFKGSDLSIEEIADELDVNHVLEGTVRWDRSVSPERVRITPQLIRVADDTNLWAETYERSMTDIFELQADIATQVAAALDVTLMDGERRVLASRPTENMEAYQAFLRGVDQLDAPDFSRENFELGQRMFERAVTLDPGFALAYARLSEMHSRMVHYGYDRSAERVSRAKAAVNRAFELEPELPEAWLALGYYYYWGLRDYDQALVALDTAQAHAPGNDDIAVARAHVLRRQGELERSAAILERELARSPLDPLATVALGETYGTLRRYEEAARAFERAIDLAPDKVYPYTELALVHLRWRGDVEAARQALASMPAVSNAESYRVAYLVDLFDREYGDAVMRLRACPEDVLEANAFYRPVTLLEAMARQAEGQDGEARAAYRSARVILERKLSGTPGDFRAHASLGLVLAGLGAAEDAVRHGEQAVSLYPLTRDALEAPVIIADLALIHAMTGDAEAAVRRLDEVLSIPSIISVAWLRHDPRWDPLRDHEAFQELLERHED